MEIQNLKTEMEYTGIDVSKSDNNLIGDKNLKTESAVNNTTLKEHINVGIYENSFAAQTPFQDKKTLFFSSESILLPEGTEILSWKLVETVSAKIIDFYDNIILLECLIDKENGIYEEREFDKSDFECFQLENGKTFKLCWYRRPGQVLMEIKDNPELIAEDDFPKSNFASEFSDLKFTK